MMAPPAYTEARLRARFHVQLKYEKPQVGSTPEHITVRGRVERVFRGANALHPGDVIQFQLAVHSDGDLIPPGGDLWLNRRDLLAGAFMEAFLNGSPPNCTLAASQCELITDLSGSPQMNVPTEKQVAAEWAAFRS